MGKLLLTKYQQMIASAVYEDRELLQVNFTPKESQNMLGNIYIGRVTNIVKNINAAFVEIQKGINCYYSLTENEYHIRVNGQEYQETIAVESSSSNDEKNAEKIQTQSNVLPKETLACGDMVMVQVMKEPVKTKAPVATSNLNFTGKYVVLSYGKPTIGISAKITDDSERKRLKEVIEPFVTPEFGFIIRTNAEGADEVQLREEITSLISIYKKLRTFGAHKTCHSLLYETPKEYLCDIRDGKQSEISEIVTDDQELYDEIKEFLSLYSDKEVSKLRLYEDPMVSLQKLYGFEEKLKDALRERVWLKSGAYLIIQPTEALTVIDVNTGKAVDGRKKAEETFFKVNLEAAEMIAKQLRLRNISGIVVIDFIDMKSQEHKNKLLARLRELAKADQVKTTIVDMTALGLVELTRKKIRKPLYEQLCQRVPEWSRDEDE